MTAKGLSADRFRELARVGAESVVEQLRAEIIAIERAFPELKLPRARRVLRRSVKEATGEPVGCLLRPRRRSLPG